MASPRKNLLSLTMQRDDSAALGVTLVLSSVLHLLLLSPIPDLRLSNRTPPEWLEVGFTTIVSPTIETTPPQIAKARPISYVPKSAPPSLTAKPEPEPSPIEAQKETVAAVVIENKNVSTETLTPDMSVLHAYLRELSTQLERHQKKYPGIAQARRWQGQVEVRLHIAGEGTLINAVVTRSSGNRILDQRALDTVYQAQPLPPLPKDLVGEDFSVDVPINFRLDS